MKFGDFVTPNCHIYVTEMQNATEGEGMEGKNPFANAATMMGNSRCAALTFHQQSFRNDIIWLEASTTSATILITGDRRFS